MALETMTRDGVHHVEEERRPATVDELQRNIRTMLRDPAATVTVRTLMTGLQRRGFRFDEPGSRAILTVDLTEVVQELGIKIGIIHPNHAPEFVLFGQDPVQP